MPALDYPSSVGALEKFPNHDAPAAARDPALKRGRGFSAGSPPNLHRQRSVQSSLARSQPVTEDGQTPRAALERTSSRGPSNITPHVRQPSHAPERSLHRSQSNTSLFSPTSSPSPSRPGPTQDLPPLPSSEASFSLPPVPRKDGPPPLAPLRAQVPESLNASFESSASDNAAPSSPTLNSFPTQQRHQQNVRSPVGRARADTVQRVAKGEPESVGGFALEHIFASFVAQADAKIDICSTIKFRMSDDILDICAHGVDRNFDQLLSAMGHLVRSKPRALIDKLILWKGKYDHRTRGHHSQSSQTTSGSSSTSSDRIKKSLDISRAAPDAISPQNSAPRVNDRLPMYNSDAEIAERKASLASYFVCRALVRIISQTTLGALTPAVAALVEDIIFDGTVHGLTREEIKNSNLQAAKWDLAVELLGVFSRLDFAGVSARYIRELKRYQKTLSSKATPRDVGEEERAYLMLKGMRHLSPSAGTEHPTWIEFCSCMQSLFELFVDVHGQKAKTEYCRTIEALLLRLAGSQEVIHYEDPRWRRVVGPLSDRLNKLMSKPKYWHAAYSANAALTCVSPDDLFLLKWQQMLTALPSRLRERNHRATCLKAVCRLVWCFMYRGKNTEGNNMPKALDDMCRAIFFTGKRYSLSRDPAVTEPLIQLIRFVGFSFPDTCFKSIIFPLVISEGPVNGQPLRVQNLDPDRIIIGIRAVIPMISDLEKKERPRFPLDFVDEWDAKDNELLAPNSPSFSKSRGRPRGPSLVRVERLSKPVAIGMFSDSVKGHYNRFCEILGTILQVCDKEFGGQAVVDEKFSTPTARTPIMDAWSFARRDDLAQFGEERFGFYDLLHAAVQALPRCLSPHTPVNALINLLCTGTAHVEKDIAASSALSLKAIARQGFAQMIVDRFSQFIFRYEDRYATMSDGGLLGPDHIEGTLKLYNELLHLWIDELRRKSSRTLSNQVASQTDGANGSFDLSTSRHHVDIAEGGGLFFLCSPSSKVRSFAVDVLKLIPELDEVLGEDRPPTRIYTLLTTGSESVLDPKAEDLSIGERARLQKGMLRYNTATTLVELCRNQDAIDTGLWYKVFPRFIKLADISCPTTVSETRASVCSRLCHLQGSISLSHEERPRAQTLSAMDAATNRPQPRPIVLPAPNEMTIEQWRLYLIFACTSIKDTGSSPSTSLEAGHVRKSSRSSQNSQETYKTASEIFEDVVPMLASESAQVRAAAVTGLSSINASLYQTLLECLGSFIHVRETEHRRNASHYRTTSSPKRQSPPSQFVPEAIEVYNLTSRFLLDPQCTKSEWVLKHIASLIQELSLHLSPVEPEHESSSLRTTLLRRHFCGLVDNFYRAVKRTAEPVRWMPFQTRRAAYVSIECWWKALNPEVPSHDRSASARIGSEYHSKQAQMTKTLVAENDKLSNAASNAMATLCGGPMTITITAGEPLYFRVVLILEWIDVMFKKDGDKYQAIGRKALRNLIESNKDMIEIINTTIEKLYVSSKLETLASYVDVLWDVCTQPNPPAVPLWKILSALLFVLGNPESRIRTKSARLLRAFEDRMGHPSRLQDFDINISDRTRAVSRAAQYSISGELATRHADCASNLFSEYSKFFIGLRADAQRNMVFAMLPWLRTIPLQYDAAGKLNATSYMVLINLLHITIRCSTALDTEVQALWQALAIGPQPGNEQIILDFVVHLSLDRKDPNFIRVAKQVTVFLSSISKDTGEIIMDNLLQKLHPKTMILENVRPIQAPSDVASLPYVVSLTEMFPNAPNARSLSVGQVSLILLVDLVVTEVPWAQDKLATLLHMVLILWDHHQETVQEQAQEMLVHLIHVLVISRVDKTAVMRRQPSVEELVDLIRSHDPKVAWSYTESSDEKSPFELPSAMRYVVSETISLFSLTMPGIKDAWGAEALEWACGCALQHLACRSLQIFRCILQPIIQPKISELTARLASSIAEDQAEAKAYSMDIIRTFKTIAMSDVSFDSPWIPQIFWTACACLNSIHEFEFLEALSILEIIVAKHDLSAEANVEHVLKFRPNLWESTFEGITTLVYKGCRSRVSMDKSLAFMENMITMGSSPLVGDVADCLRITLLANLPRFMHSFEDSRNRSEALRAAKTLHDAIIRSGITVYGSLAGTLQDYIGSQFRTRDDFTKAILEGMAPMLATGIEIHTMSFLMGLLYNPLSWMKRETLQLLELIMPQVDNSKQEIAGQGPDLYLPLLRLLHTEYCQDALRILDHVLPAVSNPADSRQLANISVTSKTINDVRKQFDKPQSIYGVPEASGWSTPMPDRQKQVAKGNLTLISASFSEANSGSELLPTPDFAFEKDEYFDDSYFPQPVTSANGATPAGTSMGELVSELDSLDDFFDGVGEDASTGAPLGRTTSAASTAAGMPEYSSKVSHSQKWHMRSHSRRQPSVTGFAQPVANGHGNSRSQEPQIMSPSAFASPPPGSRPARPGMPSRSVTMPVGGSDSSPSDKGPPRPSLDPEAFSDDDVQAGRTSASEGSMLDGSSTIRPSPSTRLNFGKIGSSLRRFGSNAHRRGTSRAQLEVTTEDPADEAPAVPRVPNEYLSNPQSSDL